ncbi:MAG: acyl-CoA dehydrogenase family protein [Alphaproteobacteria bacterium]|nr:acyl-CoA dehydrogenase family protein [Alphaproteobacteria bacterium]
MNEIVERARAFGETHVAPNAAKWAREGRMQVEALKAAAAEGLLAFQTSKAWGGLEIGFAAKLKLLEVLSRHSFDFAFSLTNTAGCAAHIAQAMPRAVAERYVPAMLKGERFGGSALSEPGVGSDFAGIKTSAVKDGDDWLLTGEKGWITNAAFGDVFITYAQTDPAQGWRGIGCFLVDGRREGFRRSNAEALGGGGVIGAGGFQLIDYRVRADEVVAPPGQAFRRAMTSVNQARTYVAAMCVAMVDACLDTAIAYGKARQAFGAPLSAKQGWRWMAADVATDAEAARLLVAKAADLIVRGEDAALASAHAKKFATRMACQRISDACQLMGAAGLREDYPFLRHLASARVASYTDGSTEMQNERIAAIVIG